MNNTELLGVGVLGFLLVVSSSTVVVAQTDMEAMWGKPLPAFCEIAKSDLRFPEFPADANRGLRMVYANGDYITALSIGTANEYMESMLGLNMVSNESRNVVWGEDCKVDIEFVFLSVSDDLANIEEIGIEDEIEIGDTDSSGSPSSNNSEQIAQNNSSSGSDSSENSPDGTLPTSLESQTENQNVVESPGQTPSGDDTNCDPPGGSGPKVVVPKVKYLLSGCIDNTSSCRSDSAVGECKVACKQYLEPPVEGGAPEEKSTVGLILPDGERIEWGRGIADSGTLTKTNPVYEGYEDMGPELILFSLSNGVQVTLDKKYGYSTAIPISMLPIWGSSVLATTEEPQIDDVGADLTLNDELEFNHLFFHKDGEQFKISLSNTTDTRFNENRNPNILPECAKSANVEYSIKINRNLNESSEENGVKVPEFFTGIDDEIMGVLAPGEEATFEVVLNAFAEQIKQYDFDQDLLYGVEIEIQLNREEDGSELHKQSFSVYRLVDVGDAHHDDNQIDFGKTFTDGQGPTTVVRHRFADILLAKNSKLTFNLQSQSDFRVVDTGTESDFQFDPAQSDQTTRKHLEETLSLVNTQDKKPVGSISLRGQTQPISYIVFNEAVFKSNMSEIDRYANQDAFSQANPLSKLIHPALVTKAERAFFNTDAKRDTLVEKVKSRMMFLWGSELNPYIKWASTPYEINGVELDWELRRNPKFTYGVTPGDTWGEGTDGFLAINSLLTDETGAVKTDLEMNRAEFAYRMNLAMNFALRKRIRLWPDSILEAHVGEIGNSGTHYSGLSLTAEQFANGMAKTAVHETSHSMGLNHVAQSDIEFAEKGEYGYQLLEFSNAIYSDRTVTLTINDRSVEVPLYENPTQKLRSQTLATLINSLPSIGVENTARNTAGVVVIACTNVGANDPPCPASLKADDQRFLLSWRGHLQAYDVEMAELSAGLVKKIKSTVAKRRLRRSMQGSVCKQAVLDLADIEPQTLFNDIMHGGANDVNGATRFQSGASLEPMKMALGINYTPDDIDKILKLYQSKLRTYRDYGSTGFLSVGPVVAAPGVPAVVGTPACPQGSTITYSNPKTAP